LFAFDAQPFFFARVFMRGSLKERRAWRIG
jgi:hypothetical protein